MGYDISTYENEKTIYGEMEENITGPASFFYMYRELEKVSTIRKYRIVQMAGNRQVSREIEHYYNLYAIISVGDRTVNSAQLLLHHGNKIGELQEIIIKHEKQGCGFGTSLFDDIKQNAEENGCLQLEVCCNQNRKASHMF